MSVTLGLGGVLMTNVRSGERVTWVVPRVPPNYANEKMHWRAKSRESRDDKFSTFAGFLSVGSPTVTLPCCVRLTLCYSHARRMDWDNLLHRLKYVRDEVASCLKAPDDRDGRWIHWSYTVEKEIPERFRGLVKPAAREGVLVEVETCK
jgi:hypothetical protein